MAADREVIQEFLATLGFQVDPLSSRKFFDTLKGSESLAKGLGAVLVGVTLAAELMVKKFAGGMERLYYASQRTHATVENLQALEFGFEQIGLSADDAQNTIESFAANLRLPSSKSFLKNLGLDPESDPTELIVGLTKKLSALPYFVGKAWAENFGISEKTFLHMKNNISDLEAGIERRRHMQSTQGGNPEQWAKDSREYMNLLREIWEQLEVISQGFASKLLPYFRQFHEVLSEILKDAASMKASDFLDLSEWMPQIASIVDELSKLYDELEKISKILHLPDLGKSLWDGFIANTKTALHLVLNTVDGMLALFTGDFKKAGNLLGKAWIQSLEINPLPGAGMVGSISKKIIGSGDATQTPTTGTIRHSTPTSSPGVPADLFARLEQQYGLPAGLLDKVWARESGRGRNMLSPAGAKGHFGFMDGTAKDFGLKDPNDLAQSATAAATYLHQLLGHYGGDLSQAVGAYNWGPGNMDKFGINSPKLPKETADYIAAIAGNQGSAPVVVSPKNNFYITGSNAQEIADKVEQAQRDINASMMRNNVGATR